MNPKLHMHLRLACLGLTVKEEISRLEAMGLDYEHDLREDLSFAQKRANLYNFWFSHPNYSSQI